MYYVNCKFAKLQPRQCKVWVICTSYVYVLAIINYFFIIYLFLQHPFQMIKGLQMITAMSFVWQQVHLEANFVVLIRYMRAEYKIHVYSFIVVYTSLEKGQDALWRMCSCLTP
jgi:hypothetical protein